MERITEIRTLWLIPARGGSKGIPDKNLKPFCGKSLVERAVAQALECAGPQDSILVSTDSTAIRQEAERLVKVPFMRPAELASDTASTHSVILHALEEYSRRMTEFERVVLLQPTSPFRTVEDINGTISKWSPDIDMAVTVSLSKANPYFNLFEEDKQGYLKVCMGEGNYSRRQDAPKVWEYNGAVYVISVGAVLKGPMSRFKKVVAYEMPPRRSIDLDTPQDWEIAEYSYKQNHMPC